MSLQQVNVFSRFERFWHWSQAALIFTLALSGFGIHGFYDGFEFQTLVQIHVLAALALVLLWVFAIFWHLTTGNWRHYLPTTQGLFAVARYYAYGIFKGEDHPYRKRFWHKHNPLQAAAYLGLKVGLFPAIWASGIAYLLYGFWSDGPLTNGAGGPLTWVAVIHTAVAFLIVAFIIIHIYLLTTSHSFKEHVSPMITGYDEVDLSPEEEAYLRQDEPGRVRDPVQ